MKKQQTFAADNDECDNMCARLLTNPATRRAFIKASLADGEKPETIKNILIGIGVYK